MRIIKDGRKINPHYFICNRCGCEFEAEDNECAYRMVKNSSTTYFHTVVDSVKLVMSCKCPNCNAVVSESERND